jgi:hypothetical protein
MLRKQLIEQEQEHLDEKKEDTREVRNHDATAKCCPGQDNRTIERRHNWNVQQSKSSSSGLHQHQLTQECHAEAADEAEEFRAEAD